MGEIGFLNLQTPKLCSKAQIFKTKLKQMKILKDLEEEHQRLVRNGGELTLAENGEKAHPFSAKGPFYSGWPGHVRGPNVPPHPCKCSAAEHEVRRPNLHFPHSCFRGPNVPPKRMHVRRPNFTFGGRTWVFLQRLFMQKLI